VATRKKSKHLRQLRTGIHWLQARLIFGLFAAFRLIPVEYATGFAAGVVRFLGPLLPRHRTGMNNLKLAFPEKTKAERQHIMMGMWDNLVRTAVEYIYLDILFDYDHENPDIGRIEIAGAENFEKLNASKKPAIIFTGHLANWELLPIGARDYGLDIASLYRTPNNPFVAARILEIRSKMMGDLIQSGRGTALKMMAVLDQGGRIGILVDQKFKSRSHLVVPFFGHPAKTNPLIGKLAREYDCAVHGARVIRLPQGRFRLEITDEITLPRDAEGRIDAKKAVVAVTQIVEDWVREYPEQWLWLHRRWDK
jgi:Kdo2-lipid IVA lauroyltransferase/acyltransferase